jgi:hypothetical protein
VFERGARLRKFIEPRHLSNKKGKVVCKYTLHDVAVVVNCVCRRPFEFLRERKTASSIVRIQHALLLVQV